MPATSVEVPFACPMCSAQQQVALVALSRAGFHRCDGCRRRLTPAQVSHAIHTGPPIRAHRAPTGFDTVPGVRTRLLP